MILGDLISFLDFLLHPPKSMILDDIEMTQPENEEKGWKLYSLSQEISGKH